MNFSDLAPLVIALPFCWFAARRLLTYLHIFQQDEYDGARFLRWLVATRSVDRKLSLALVALGVAAILVPAPGAWLTAVAAGLVLVVSGVIEADPRKQAKKKLVLTDRARRILAVAFALAVPSGAAIGWFVRNPAIWVVSVQLIPVDLVIANLMLSPVEARIQRKFWNEAHDKLRRLAPVVIAITGSYGKTSAKHILGHILEATSTALITPGSVNTPMGIARIVREQLQPWHRFFVVEMGAYGPGSIARLCRLASPALGLITAIGKAHFERFKSLDTVARTKFELAEAVARNGGKLITHEDVLAFPAAQAFAAAHPDLMLVCGTRDGLSLARFQAEWRPVGRPESAPDFKFKAHSDAKPVSTFAECALWLESVRQDKDGLVVAVAWHGRPYSLAAPLYGAHQGANMALAFAAACSLGIDPDAAILALRSTPQIPHRLEVRPQAGGSILIDDGYNSNPVGFAAALDLLPVLRSAPGRSILITPGMVELGAAHDEEHARLGRKAAGLVDVLLPVVPDRITSFVDAFRASAAAATVIPCQNFAAARDWMAGNLRAGDVVLIENDLPDLYERRLRL